MAGKSIKLLVADDDRDLCNSYVQSIRGFDADIVVKVATDGSQAANFVRTERFDGLVLDIRLPTMNGLQVGRIARDTELNKSTPIIVISGSLDPEAQQRAQALGRVKVLAKPIETVDFIEALSASLQAGKKPAYDARVVDLLRQAVHAALSAHVDANLLAAGPITVKAPAAESIAGLTILYGITSDGVPATLRLFLSEGAIAAMGHGGVDFEWDDGAISRTVIEVAPQISAAVVQAVARRVDKAGPQLSCSLIDVLHGVGSRILARAGSQVIVMPFQIQGHPVQAELVLAVAKSGLGL